MKSRAARLIAIFVLGLTLGTLAAAKDPVSPNHAQNQKGETHAKPAKQEPPLAFSELTVLERYLGPWNVRESHFNPLGQVVGTSKGIEEGVWVLDKRVLRRAYTTGEEGSLYRAIAMLSWNPTRKQFEGTWFDNASTSGPTDAVGSWDESTRTMTFTLTTHDSEGKPLQYKVVDRFETDEIHVATTFKLADGRLEKVLEVQFKRAIPCPANVGIIKDVE